VTIGTIPDPVFRDTTGSAPPEPGRATTAGTGRA